MHLLLYGRPPITNEDECLVHSEETFKEARGFDEDNTKDLIE